MKRLGRSIALIIAGVCLLTVASYASTRVGDFVWVDFYTYQWDAYTYDSVEGSNSEERIGLSEQSIKQYMEENDLVAIAFHDDIELDIQIDETDTGINNLANYSADEIRSELLTYMLNLSEEEVADEAMLVYEGSTNPYVYNIRDDNGTYIYSYITIVNHKDVILRAIANRKLTDKERKLIEDTIDSIKYEVYPEYENEDVAPRLIYAVIVAVVIALIAAVVVFISRKRKKLINFDESTSAKVESETDNSEMEHKSDDITSDDIDRQHENSIDESTEISAMGDNLRQLKELYDEGILTDEEFKEKKKEILGL